jgi:two-component system sensor histidine kinase KdpD
MERVFRNLLENAAKYTPAGTRVEISASVAGQRLQIVVADNGPGLPAGDPEQLFAKFQRGTSESTVGGVGLGLAICRAVVGAHQGTISATSSGGGARFIIDLPLEPDAPRLDAETTKELTGSK